MNIQVETGAEAYAPKSEPITDLAFGVRFTTFTDLDGFLDQIADLNVGVIVWPGGTLAEERTDRYGLEHEGLYAPGYGQADLGDMMQVAIAQDAALSVVLPTHRYAGDPAAAQADVAGFMDDLIGGTYGALPKSLILEIGNEYFAHFGEGAGPAANYAEVADAMITEVGRALDGAGLSVEIAVQAGKTLTDDTAIRAEMSSESMGYIDMLTHHRFPFLPQGFDRRIPELEEIVAGWTSDLGTEPDLFVSAYNTAALTRNDALELYLTQNPGADVDLDGRTTTQFEEFWQAELQKYAFGDRHPGMILEAFASYAEAGMDAAAVFGVEFPHPGRLSYEIRDGSEHIFAGGEMLRMIYESVEGTRVLESQGAYDQTADVTTYGFENEDKLVLFLAGGKTAPGEITIDLDGYGTTYQALWAESLTAETAPDWKSTYEIPDNPAVDETPEGNTYAVGVRAPVETELEPGRITLDLGAHEVVRLAFSKSVDGLHEIQSWSEGPGTMMIFSDDPSDEEVTLGQEPETTFLEEVLGDDGGSGSALGALLLLPLLFFA